MNFSNSAIRTLLGCWLIQLIAGISLSLGNIIVYIVSYFRVSRHCNVTEDTFFPIQTLTLFFTVVSFPVGFWLVDHFGGKSRPVIVVGSIISLSMLVSIKYISYSPEVFILVYSLGNGIMKGFIQSSSLAAGWSHLP